MKLHGRACNGVGACLHLKSKQNSQITAQTLLDNNLLGVIVIYYLLKIQNSKIPACHSDIVVRADKGLCKQTDTVQVLYPVPFVTASYCNSATLNSNLSKLQESDAEFERARLIFIKIELLAALLIHCQQCILYFTLKHNSLKDQTPK